MRDGERRSRARDLEPRLPRLDDGALLGVRLRERLPRLRRLGQLGAQRVGLDAQLDRARLRRPQLPRQLLLARVRRLQCALVPVALRVEPLVALALQLEGRLERGLLERRQLVLVRAALGRRHGPKRVHGRVQCLLVLLAIALAERNLRLELGRVPPALGNHRTERRRQLGVLVHQVLLPDQPRAPSAHGSAATRNRAGLLVVAVKVVPAVGVGVAGLSFAAHQLGDQTDEWHQEEQDEHRLIRLDGQVR